MKNKRKKLIFFLALGILFLSFIFVSAQERELEVKYPKLFGAPPQYEEEDLLPKYVSYIFNLIIVVSGLIAFGALIYSGIRYLTSSGDPEKTKSAKQQITATFWGILIILASFLILQSINPQLTLVKMKVKDLGLLPDLPSSPPPAPPTYPNYLWRISEIANTTKLIVEQDKGLVKTAGRIHSLTAECNCSLTNPLCLCREYIGGGCQAIYCYAGSVNQPCPHEEGLKKEQQTLIASLSEILYYKKRAMAEREDFLLEIEDTAKEITFYQEKLATEKDDYFKEKYEEILVRTEIKNDLYHQLEEELQKLVDLINGMSLAADKLSKLPDGLPQEGILGCLENVKNQCQGKCSGGCHDTLECSPISCSGGNPCPIQQIIQEKQTINSFGGRITKVCDNVLNIIKQTEKVKMK